MTAIRNTWKCAVCGAVEEAGTGWWAFPDDGDDAQVCRGKCWRTHQATKAAQQEEALWLSAFARWST